ncbi:alpha/beta fold hydrolase [Synechococcus sp. RS9916]|uniref:alpha/beta fold hydrolase n=1 Tax=Synechococcus sp. RS9916 TaxID=221359 RepID=UPI0000E53FC9|nr:alpha/beta hydrolase [Synechococcus sp. RS9916]EAU73517.1 hypothetical protein RS9916_28449 [Synechococcus sp. RS9916]
MTKIIPKNILILAALFLPIQANTQTAFAETDKTTLHFKHFPNPKSEFKGTFLFQNGSGTSLEEWTNNKKFFDCVKRNGSALMYDRSGLGKSPPDFSISTENPITAKLVNSKLISLLKANQITAPYILVSHSHGGMYSGYFARKYPDSIAGMLMVAPVPPDYQYSSTVMEKFRITQAKLKGKSSKEAYKLDNLDSPSEGNTMTADAFYQQLGFETTKEQVSKLPEMTSNFPITILSSSDMGKNAPIKGDWHTLQKQWLNQNPESMILQAQGGHFLQFDQPRLICKELKKLVDIAIQSSKEDSRLQ